VRRLILLLLLGMVTSIFAKEDLIAPAQAREKLESTLLKGQKGDPSSAAEIEISLRDLSPSWSSPEIPDNEAIIAVTRAAQSLMIYGQGKRAYGLLQGVQRSRPGAIHSPLYCYQLFFTALYGTGDRAAARAVLRWMDKEVAEGRLSAEAPEYIAVTAGWDRALQYSDSDLPRIARLDNQAMLQSNAR
jgi:hypothetical protein